MSDNEGSPSKFVVRSKARRDDNSFHFVGHVEVRGYSCMEYSGSNVATVTHVDGALPFDEEQMIVAKACAHIASRRYGDLFVVVPWANAYRTVEEVPEADHVE